MDILSGLPDATVIRDPGDLAPFMVDESHVRGVLPLAMVKPHGPRALRELVRRAKGEGFGLVPRGAGTGKAGGCVPTARTVVVASDIDGYRDAAGGLAVLSPPGDAQSRREGDMTIGSGDVLWRS